MTRITFFLMALVFAGSVNAQMSFGPKLALNFSNISFSNDDYKTSLVPGVTLGGFANYALDEKMAVQGELLYSAEGNNWKSPQYDAKAKIRSGQIRIPVVFQYTVAKQLYLEAGPQAKILIAMSQTIDGYDKQDIAEHYNTVSFGLAGGIGYRFTGKAEGLSAGFRYFGDLGKFNKANVGGGNLKTYGFMLGVEYRLWK